MVGFGLAISLRVFAGANIEGNPWFTLNKAEMLEDGNYLGFHRFGKRVVSNTKSERPVFR